MDFSIQAIVHFNAQKNVDRILLKKDSKNNLQDKWELERKKNFLTKK